MRHSFSLKNPVITGTLILTIAGCISRVIGFFYRIFLSHTIGADGLGLFQLSIPVFAIASAISFTGLETTVSRFTARCLAQKNKEKARMYLAAGLLLCLFVSGLCCALLFFFSNEIARVFLKEPDCAPFVRVFGLTLPAAGIHTCVTGYYYGQKKAAFPSITQLAEQLGRVGVVFLLYAICRSQNRPFLPVNAAYGFAAGEFLSMLISLSVSKLPRPDRQLFHCLKEVIPMTLPLSINRLVLTFFQSIETVLIPEMLLQNGYSRTQSLSVFGILTGMALPVILFPSVLTGSFATLLLPVISEAQVQKNHAKIHRTLIQTISVCLILGLSSTLFFLLAGPVIGKILFHSRLAGSFIQSLGWLCPFLFLNTILKSMLHGLGKTTVSLFINLSGCLIRILSIFFGIPLFGLRALFWGLLISHLLMSLCSIHFVRTLC
ncbi:MAG: oligosaccharide flippase family protein [Lachnospiraceae bacterium]